MSKDPTPEGQVRRWVEGVLGQADEDVAATTLAVLWNGSSVGGPPPGAASSVPPVAPCCSMRLLRSAATHLRWTPNSPGTPTFGMLSDCLWQKMQPTRAEVETRDLLLPWCGDTLDSSVYTNSSGTQLGARFSMKACIPSHGSGDSARAQNIVW